MCVLCSLSYCLHLYDEHIVKLPRDPMIAAPTYFGRFAVHVCNAPDPGRGVTRATPVTPT